MSFFKITTKSKKSSARLGVVHTNHGDIETPFFMPDATRGYVKLLDVEDAKRVGLGPLVVNTLHLYLRPGMPLIKRFRGVHGYMHWDKPLLSDSGGFQVYSLVHQNKNMGKITDEHVMFRSPLDGSKHILTPEKSIQIQFDLGTDMIVCLDDCPPHDLKKAEMRRSVERTIAWAKRCKAAYAKELKKRKISASKRPLFFAVIQGGEDKALRKECAEALIKIGFDGYGYGARPVDTKGKFLADILQYTAKLIPEDTLRFALGVGTPDDIVRCVQMGWDMFDCVIPTREGRHGRLFVWSVSLRAKRSNPDVIFESSLGLPRRSAPRNDSFYTTLNITNSQFKSDKKPVDKNCDCILCKNYSRAYLYQLFKTQDFLGQRLATIHNLRFYIQLMERIRLSIKQEVL